MNKEDLKKKIFEANALYRAGSSKITDSEYDRLVDEFKKSYPDEYDDFRDSLNEGIIESGNKLKHKYIIGSLDKIKNSDESALSKFIKKQIKTKLNISAKVDGISSVAHYSNGKLIEFASRGDGYEGTDFFNKSPFIKGLLQTISCKDDIYIRGELVILNSECIDTSTNYRNICAGYMNSKYWKKEDISKISFVPYTILGDKYNKHEQFKLLVEFGFNAVWNETLDPNEEDLISILTRKAKLVHNYSCDGLVLTDDNAYNELDSYRPKNAMAFKINELTATTKVIDIDWSSVSKDGYINPVFILEPVELGGAIISRASASNLDIIKNLGVKYGSIVEITKANDIIPHVDKVIDNSNTTEIDFPTECPCCGSKLERDGINLRCKNKKCPEQVAHQIAYFIKKLGVKHTSEASLKNFKIDSFDALLKFKPNSKHKSEVKLVEELKANVFNKSRQELLAAMNFKGVGEILINKIVDFYGYDNLKSMNFNGLPDGVGEITLQKFKDDLLENLTNVDKFINDSRYCYSKINDETSNVKAANKKNMSVCFTGKLNTMSRSKAEKLARDNGYDVLGGVNKKLTYLVTNDSNTQSNKGKKARDLGIKILSEFEFVKLCNNDQFDITILN